MALTSINKAATVKNPKGAQAVRNPQYDAYGNIIGSGSKPGLNDLDFTRNNSSTPNPGTPSTPIAGGGTNPGNPVGPNNRRQGVRGNIARQFAQMNRADPRQNRSLTAEELRLAALARLRGA